jgi:alpha-L-rhamnosidase
MAQNPQRSPCHLLLLLRPDPDGRLCRPAGQQRQSHRYRAEAAKIKQAFNDKLYDAEKGCYGNGSQTSQILPLRFGMVPSQRREKIFNYIVNHIDTHTGGAIGTGLVGGQWLMRSLSDNGRLDIAYRFAASRQYPSWGYMIEKGATTIWELWNGDTASPI